MDENSWWKIAVIVLVSLVVYEANCRATYKYLRERILKGEDPLTREEFEKYQYLLHKFSTQQWLFYNEALPIDDLSSRVDQTKFASLEPEPYVKRIDKDKDIEEDMEFHIQYTREKYEKGAHLWSSLESFSINFENIQFILFDFTSINIFMNFMVIILIFSIVFSNSLNIKRNINVINFFNLIISFFFNMFKTLIQSIRLERFFIFIFSIFLFVLFQNLGGFSLYEVSFTSHAIITLFLSFIIFFNYFINYIINFNELSYEKFMQKNLNIILVSVLFIIEIVSFFVRPFSLGVRLFANILSGHILMHIFFNAFLAAYKMFFWLSFFLLIFCLFILTMEVFVSCVQAYIFFILAIIYLQDVCKIHA